MMATTSSSGSNSSTPLQTLQRPASPISTSSSTVGNNAVGSNTGLAQSAAPVNGVSTTNAGITMSPGPGISKPLSSPPLSPTLQAATPQSGRISFTEGVWEKLGEKFAPAEEPVNGSRPHNLTVIVCVYGFIACAVIIFSCAAVASVASLYVAGIAGLVIVCAMGVRSGIDEWFWDRQCRRTYSRNLGNTVLQTTVASLLMVCLFTFRWYPMFHSTHLVLTSDVSGEMSWPSFSLLQRVDWSSEANLYSNNTKCYTRWYDEGATKCPTSRPGQDLKPVPVSESCDCKELWSDKIEENFMIGDAAYRLLRFGAASQITAAAPYILLWAQAFFDYNATQAEHDNGWLPQPGLSIAMYDPRLSLELALVLNRTRLIDIDASAITSINVEIRLYESLNGTELYDYDITTSPRTSTTLTCNTGGNGTFEYLCATTLQIRIPSFMRTRVREEADMNWVGMAVEAGAWYSLAQFVGWTLSGAAFAF